MPTRDPDSLALPVELISRILEFVADWELATTLNFPHQIPITSPWLEQATPLDHAILASSRSLRPVLSAVRAGHSTFTQWGARVMIRFEYLHLLEYFQEKDPKQLRRQCYSLLPVVASAWGRVEVLRWATTSEFKLRPDRSTTAEAMDDASRHGQVQVLEFWKNSGFPLHYSEHALSSATFQCELGSLEWWRRSGLSLKIGNVLDFASREGSTTCLNWWSHSGLPAPYSKVALYHLSKTGNITLLDWWKSSRHPLLYDKEVLIVATRHGQTSVLTWWKESGLDIEYRFFDIEEALEDSVARQGRDDAEAWWQVNAGYDVTLGAREGRGGGGGGGLIGKDVILVQFLIIVFWRLQEKRDVDAGPQAQWGAVELSVFNHWCSYTSSSQNAGRSQRQRVLGCSELSMGRPTRRGRAPLLFLPPLLHSSSSDRLRLLFSMLNRLHAILGIALLASSAMAQREVVIVDRRLQRPLPEDAIILDLSIDGPLVECGTVTLNWTSDKIPKNRAVTSFIAADLTWEIEKIQKARLPRQDFVTPQTSISWKVNYPAAITIFTILILAVVNLGGYLCYRGFVAYRARANGVIRLEEDPEENAAVASSS
ncbi:hypothetical protein P7C70_g4967, partial [Phenoliferia sp. Uapishka_3]